MELNGKSGLVKKCNSTFIPLSLGLRGLRGPSISTQNNIFPLLFFKYFNYSRSCGSWEGRTKKMDTSSLSNQIKMEGQTCL